MKCFSALLMIALSALGIASATYTCQYEVLGTVLKLGGTCLPEPAPDSGIICCRPHNSPLLRVIEQEDNCPAGKKCCLDIGVLGSENVSGLQLDCVLPASTLP